MSGSPTKTQGTEHNVGSEGLKVTVDLVQKLRRVRDALAEGLVERDVAVRLGLLAALAGEHLLMLGPPGTAKSLIARRLHLAFSRSTYFERLLTRFTVPEELFGPLSIKGLEEDRYERLTNAYLPKASIAFLDEIFKANSAILNALLTLLNEREFDNGAVRDKTPLVAVIGASNELPEGDELTALFDRFLLRLHVGPVTKEAFPKLLSLRGQSTPQVHANLQLRSYELQAVQDAAEAVELSADVVSLLCDLRDWCTAEGIQVSVRRWRKVVKLLQVSAATNGRTSVSIWDCWLLQHCLWDRPEAREKVFDWYSTRAGASAAMDPSRLTTIIISWEAKLQADKDSRSQVQDSDGKLLFKKPNGEATTDHVPNRLLRETNPLFLAPADSYDPKTEMRIKDRKNLYKGYTRQELSSLHVLEGGRWYTFEHSSMRDSYLADENNWLMEDGPFSPIMEPTRHKDVYIDHCVGQMNELQSDVETYRGKLMMHMNSMKTEICDHLWVTPEFFILASKSLMQTLQNIDTLLRRVISLKNGFSKLPRIIDSTLNNLKVPR